MKNARLLLICLLAVSSIVPAKAKTAEAKPRAIAMWDFSWLERRWTGAGFEDWDKVLDEFTDRGYNAVRIDAYPHLVAANPEGEWLLEECWNTQDWGSPDYNRVKVQPALNEFLSKCRDRDIKVGLSTWFRRDTTHQEMSIKSPEDLAGIWIKTLKTIEEAGLLDVILYVDLCNEWPGDAWAPFFNAQHPEVVWGDWDAKESMRWMNRSLELVGAAYPELPVLFSFDSQNIGKYTPETTKSLDLAEQHMWMVQQNGGEFYKEVGYNYERFSPQGYKNFSLNWKKAYYSRPDYWKKLLTDQINAFAGKSRELGLPLITTECWGSVDYKDWPLLEWGWVKDLCALGTETAASSGQWVAIATSNFCCPQFAGMWRDVEWHRHLTSIIRNSRIDESILKNPRAQKILKRL